MNTWGISGPAFLALYCVLLAATVVAVVVADRRDGRGRSPLGTGLDQYQVALLNGGDQLVASVALFNLDRMGAIELGDRLLRELAETNDIDLERLTERQLDDLGVGMHITVLTPHPAGLHPVEAAVHRAAKKGRSRTPDEVISKAVGSGEFADLHNGLVADGLLRSPEELARQGRRWRYFLPVLALGVVRFSYGVSREKPVGYLLVLLLVAGAAAYATARHRSERTAQANALLDELRRAHPDPYETIESAGGHRAPHLGMALALTGTAPLWDTSPALAAALGAPSAVEPTTKWWHGGGDWGGGWGWGCGAGGGGGGGCGGGGGGGGGGGSGCGG